MCFDFVVDKNSTVRWSASRVGLRFGPPWPGFGAARLFRLSRRHEHWRTGLRLFEWGSFHLIQPYQWKMPLPQSIPDQLDTSVPSTSSAAQVTLGWLFPTPQARRRECSAASSNVLRRSGLMDPRFRFAMNLKGAPAMNLGEFARYRQKTNVGASLVVVAPLGQYDANKLINLGSNRWIVKPEVGLSRAFGRWVLDAYGGVWLFTPNSNFQGGTRKQDPLWTSPIPFELQFAPTSVGWLRHQLLRRRADHCRWCPALRSPAKFSRWGNGVRTPRPASFLEVRPTASAPSSLLAGTSNRCPWPTSISGALASNPRLMPFPCGPLLAGQDQVSLLNHETCGDRAESSTCSSPLAGEPGHCRSHRCRPICEPDRDRRPPKLFSVISPG